MEQKKEKVQKTKTELKSNKGLDGKSGSKEDRANKKSSKRSTTDTTPTSRTKSTEDKQKRSSTASRTRSGSSSKKSTSSTTKTTSSKEKTDSPIATRTRSSSKRSSSKSAAATSPKKAKTSPDSDKKSSDQKSSNPTSKSTSKSKSKSKSKSTTKSKKSTSTIPLSPSPSLPRDARLIQVTEETLAKLAPKEADTTFDAAPEKGCKKITKWKSVKPSEDEDCPICLCPLSGDVVKLSECTGHIFHQDCIAFCYDKSGPFLKCPICSYVYGTRVGNMPPGTMTVTTSATPLPGYSGCGTITINYSFNGGTQGPEHRFPGTPYSGTSRVCYLPDNAEGKEVLRLLDIAFKRKLTFTIGTSVTSGATNTVIWNGIHHKTCTTGGPTNYGYPDDEYLSRVKDELKAVGVE